MLPVASNLEPPPNRGLPCAIGALQPSTFHSQKTVSKFTPEGYIHEHYSPKSGRKFPPTVDDSPLKYRSKDLSKLLKSLNQSTINHLDNNPTQIATKPHTESVLKSKLKHSPPPEQRPPELQWRANMFRGGMKLKERVIVGVSVAAVLFTFLLVVDIQMDLGMSGHHLVPSHGRVKYVQEEGVGSAYNSFRKRFLQKTHRY